VYEDDCRIVPKEGIFHDADEGEENAAQTGTQIYSSPKSNTRALSGSKTSKPEVNCLNQAIALRTPLSAQQGFQHQ
jgi:hypothetical protein